MSAVLNRNTKELKKSVNEPDYPVADWIHNPDLSAVDGFQSKYWVISGDSVSLMDLANRDAVDAAELAASRNSSVASLLDEESITRAVSLRIFDEFSIHADRINFLISSIQNSSNMTELKAALASVQPIPRKIIADVITEVSSKLGVK